MVPGKEAAPGWARPAEDARRELGLLRRLAACVRIYALAQRRARLEWRLAQQAGIPGPEAAAGALQELAHAQHELFAALEALDAWERKR